jgi:hypothetical protein
MPKNIGIMSWGINSSEIACYQENKPTTETFKVEGNQSDIVSPLIFRRKINGVWAEVQ